MKLSRRPLSFAAVGTVGFAVDAAAFLFFFYLLGFGHYTSRVAAFLCAVSLTWVLNRTYTFRAAATANKAKEYAGYVVVQTMGALINIVIFGLCIESSTMFFEFPVLALTLGSVVAMFFNYAGAYRFVYRGGGAE